uniref:FAD-dependent protein C-terminal domain-containing protein n=2 Tax=Pseudo-nitzschia australis TaxID=44445 RepID=A0A6U9W6G9_9STRA|mmetsp:Transcript_25772/g.56542  ORF Transcript_25772/g.56542 Transcript_25772/m.56542 type:complete len:718 (+) Transcript_25772:78-2231(+)
MSNRYSFLVPVLQLFLVAVLTVKKITVVSFTALPQNGLRAGQFQSRLRSSVIVAASQSNERNKNPRKKKRKKKTSFDKKAENKKDFVHGGIEVWRIYGISVHPDALEKDRPPSTGAKKAAEPVDQLPAALQKALIGKLRLESIPVGTRVVRRSLDARKKLDHPIYSYVVDIPIEGSLRHSLRWQVKSGRMEKIESITGKKENKTDSNSDHKDDTGNEDQTKNIVVVGMGPAGLFCALQLALGSNGKVRPILLDRGQPVHKRGQDIGRLIHRRVLNEESNFVFGEGGAGTWSDGKLTTRIGRNSGTVRLVLETLVEFGAPADILWKGAPHLGTDNLVKLLRNMRFRLAELGGEIRFGTKMTNIKMDGNKVCGVLAEDGDGNEQYFEGDHVVLATGHSARDVYETLNRAGVKLEPKGFAVGFRIEHPQRIINKIQYGDEWGPSVKTGKSLTDAENEEFFGTKPEHIAKMPPPSYRLATDKAMDGVDGNCRGAYSFCMCPGGQIVPASTDPEEVCVNGMSFSRRDSKWANSALVVTVDPDDKILDKYRTDHGVMAGLEFQRDMERRASKFGGGNLTVPVQRMTDFCDSKVSSTIPSSSYRLGVKSAPCHEIYPEPITNALRDALTNHFQKQMPGYYHPDGLLHAVETRTSSTLRVPRDRNTFLAIGTENLYPSGEGAGYAGGIVSAAVDGINVAETILDTIYGESRPDRIETGKSVGFSY